MIDGALACNADEPDVREWQACQWPGGCKRGGVRLVDMPGVGERWLCRRHAGETWPGCPVVKVRKHDDPRACQWPGGCNRRALRKVAVPGVGERWLCRVHAQEEAEARNLRRRRQARTAARAAHSPPVKIEPSPARAPRKPSVDDEARRPVEHHRRRQREPGLVVAVLTLIHVLAAAIHVLAGVAVLMVMGAVFWLVFIMLPVSLLVSIL